LGLGLVTIMVQLPPHWMLLWASLPRRLRVDTWPGLEPPKVEWPSCHHLFVF
jgi:hypothetical protein